MTSLDTLAKELCDAFTVGAGPTQNAWQVVARLVQQKITTAQREAYAQGMVVMTDYRFTITDAREDAERRYPLSTPDAPQKIARTGDWSKWQDMAAMLHKLCDAVDALQSRAEPR